MSMSEIQPIRPIAPYLGGKKNLAKRICAIIDRDTHETYAEPFVGMGGIFLRRGRRPAQELINDRSRDIANFFLILREHYPGREVVGIDARPLFARGGGIHCITLHQPA